MRIGASRQKYSPWLIIHFSRTEQFQDDGSGGGDGGISLSSGTVDPFFNNIILLWHADGNYIDYSPDQRVINTQWQTTLTGSFVSGRFGSAMAFAGGPEIFGEGPMLVVTPGPTGDAFFEASTPFTIEGWINPDFPPEYSALPPMTAFGFYKRDNQENRSVVIQVSRNRKVLVNWQNSFAGYSEFLTSSATIASSGWTHVALVRELSGTSTLYMGGKATGPKIVDSSRIQGELGRLVIAGNRDVSTRFQLFSGSIDEVRFTKLTARYTSNFTPAGPFPNTG